MNITRRWAEGMLLPLILLAAGCFPVDSAHELDYVRAPGAAQMNYKLRIENAAHTDKAPVLMRLDDHDPVLIRRWREVLLTRGPHVVRVASPEPQAWTEQRFDLNDSVDLFIRDPALTVVPKNAPPIAVKLQRCGHVVLAAPGGGVWGECTIENTSLFTDAQVQIDDYPPIRVSGYSIPMYVSMRSGRHNVVATLPATKNRPELRFSRSFNIAEVGGKIIVHEKSCPKDTRPSGLYEPEAVVTRTVVQYSN